MIKGIKKIAKRVLRAGLDAARRANSTVMHWLYSRDERPGQSVTYSDISHVRGDARYEFQNNPHAFGFAEVFDLYVVGDKGPRLKFFGHPLSPQWNKQHEMFRDWVTFKWEQWCKSAKVRDTLSLAIKAMIVDGSAFLVISRNSKRKIFPASYEVIEPQRVRNPNAMRNGRYDFGYLINGLIFDHEGNLDRVVVLNEPSTDMEGFLDNRYSILESDHVHVLTKTILPGQVMGWSWFAPSLELLGQLRDGSTAMVENMKNSAAIIATVESEHGFEHDDSMFGENNGPHYSPYETRNLPLNRVMLMPPKSKMNAFKPEQPQSGFRDTFVNMIAAAGRGLGLTENKSTGSSKEYNFSSARIDEQQFNLKVSRIQSDIKETCLEPLFAAFYEYLYPGAVAKFGLSIPKPDEVYFDFSFPKPPPHDPVTQANADGMNLKNGFLTHKMYYEDQYGEDFDDHIVDIEQGKKVVPAAYGITGGGERHAGDDGEPTNKENNDGTDVYQGVDESEDNSGTPPAGGH